MYENEGVVANESDRESMKIVEGVALEMRKKSSPCTIDFINLI